jgi:hypothetical protein
MKTAAVTQHFSSRITSRVYSRVFAAVCCAILLAAALAASGCHSYHIDATVENRTGGTVKLLEVDYPSASFGVDMLGASSVFHYRIQIRGSGPLKLQYTAANGSQATVNGPSVSEGQEGTLEIVLLPGGKAEFHPHLSAAH